jgi:hypothetical protein
MKYRDDLEAGPTQLGVPLLQLANVQQAHGA